ncbi:MAG: extracellular solute-binding protein [Spirochaetaceae bacterium]|jgi:multiple sugar transport system substrate-binding protein|uniref:Extracellular solute-binding protein n=1 Tax=Sphaerochaeta halotolerans TaxID=2293840 RepID=A0A372MG03_9SPIR|nr:extracellular solute-binding protein [Sphaerochaeta halotolerans]MBG0767847.1 extracellular solute-binding protein [Spirochaetaceae bacterium]RFU94692.1 extracellular solute-binding protein [Sphaerochaeta halotolerans]
MKRSIALVLMATLLIPFSLFAQGGKEAVVDENAPVTVQYWTHEDPARTDLENELIATFMAQNPNITVVRTTQSSAKQIELVQTAFAANQGPDMFNLPIENQYAYITNYRVAPVDYQAAGYANKQDLLDNYVEGVLDTVTVDGEVYGLPLELTNWAIYVNKKIFRDAGLNPETDYPKTWEEMADVSEKLVIRDGDILIRRGFDFRYPYYLTFFVPMVEQLGGELISSDGKQAIVNDDAWIKALTYMQEWGPSGRNLGSPTYKNARKLFNLDNNDIAMAHSGLYQEGRIEADNPEFFESGEWMVIPYPVFEDAVRDVASCYYGHFFMVNIDSDPAVQKAAWKLAGFLLSHGEDYLTRGGNIIQPTKALFASDTLKNMPYSDVFINDMGRAHMIYYGANSAEIQTQIRYAVESVMLSGVSPQKALATLRSAVQEIIDEQ